MSEVIVLQHIHCETLGTIGDALDSAGLTYRYVRGFAGEPVPGQIADAPALVVMGGPMGVYEEDRYPFLTNEMRLIGDAIENNVPVLGVCLGSQLVASVLGATVRPGPRQEIGWHPITLSDQANDDPLWMGIPTPFMGFHWHGDTYDTPPGAVDLASSDITPSQLFRFGSRTYGIQFYPEATDAIIHAWTTEFAPTLTAEGIDPTTIHDGIPAYLPMLQKVGDAVFGRWAAGLP